MRAVLFACALCTFPTLALGQADNYDNCVKWVAGDPSQALNHANNWRDAGGGLPARHCRVLALAAMNDFSTAALEAESIAAETPNGSDYVNLLIQAGEFRMAAGDGLGARTQFDRALSKEPGNGDALDGRARAAAALGDFPAAIADLDALIALQPSNAEAYALRAAARRQSGDKAGGLADAEMAVGADPNSAVAYFERGAARAVTGDIDGARFDWQQATALDPGGPTGDLANANLARLGAQ